MDKIKVGDVYKNLNDTFKIMSISEDADVIKAWQHSSRKTLTFYWNDFICDYLFEGRISLGVFSHNSQESK